MVFCPFNIGCILLKTMVYGIEIEIDKIFVHYIHIILTRNRDNFYYNF